MSKYFPKPYDKDINIMVDLSDYATKTILNTKINEVKSKIPSITGLATTSALTIAENKITDVSNLVTKTDFNNLVTKTDFKKTDYLTGKSYFDEDGSQNYLVFQSILKYLTLNDNKKYIIKLKSKGLSNEDLEFVYTSRTIITSEINHNENKVRLNFQEVFYNKK